MMKVGKLIKFQTWKMAGVYKVIDDPPAGGHLSVFVYLKVTTISEYLI